jgi:hypothetical protein
LPWSTFDRIVARYDGNRAVRTLSCATQYQVMAFAQITYRESLRDIEACLSAQSAKLYHMGFRGPVRRSTLADANETHVTILAEMADHMPEIGYPHHSSAAGGRLGSMLPTMVLYVAGPTATAW